MTPPPPPLLQISNLSRATSFACAPFLRRTALPCTALHCSATALQLRCSAWTKDRLLLCCTFLRPHACGVDINPQQQQQPHWTPPIANCPLPAMARTFKFPFPLSSRRQNLDSCSTSPYDPTDLPFVSRGSKADRVLGASDPALKAAARKSSGGKEKKGHRQADYMSVTVLETEALWPQSPNSTTGIPLHPLRSSPLPQRPYMETAADWDAGSLTGTARIPLRSQSSSTLQSYYDSSKSPLSISQQTSASSARDMALRKGYPSIISSPTPNRSGINGTPATPTGNDQARTRSRPKQLNLQLGISSLLHKPDPPVQPLLSPNHIVTSPSHISIASGHRNRPRLLPWETKKSKESLPGGVEDFQDLGRRVENPPPTAETRRKPHPEEVVTDRIHSDGLSQHPLRPDLEGSVNGTRADHSRRHRLRRSKSSISELSEEEANQCNSRAHPHSTSVPCDASPLRHQRHADPDVASKAEGPKGGHGAKESSTMIFPTINIHEQSFLIFSSSDDENEVCAKPTETMSRRQRIRASIDKADFADEVVVCSAQRLTHVKPRPVVNLPRRRTSRPQEPDSIPPVPSIPAINPRISSMRWREEYQNFLPILETMNASLHSRQSSRTSHSASRLSPMGSQLKPLGRESKMMAVTAEEEKLLEAMRRKRASIRQEILAAHIDDLSLLQHHMKSCFRPRTAEDGPCQPSHFHSERSISPSLRSGSMHGGLKFSAATSADGISHDEPSFLRSAVSVCKCPTRSSSPGGAGRVSTTFSEPVMSMPHLSFNPSDILPSTPAMSEATEEEVHGAAPLADLASPLTPPLDHGAMDLYATELRVKDLSSHSEPISVVNERGFDGKPPVGNRIVVVDGSGRDSGELMEENGMSSWAEDRW